MIEKAPSDPFESLVVRQARVVDSDKVRYRVYRTATEYVAVIAESALMAMKVSEISAPYRIVRDLPTHGLAVTAEQLVQAEEARIALPRTGKESSNKTAFVKLKQAEAPKEMQFQSLHLGQLQVEKTAPPPVLSPQEATEAAAVSTPAQPTPSPPPEVVSAIAPEAPAAVSIPVEDAPPVMAADAEAPLSPDEVNRLLGS